MSFSDALIYSLLGVLVVFFALILLMIIIKLLIAFTSPKDKKIVSEAVTAEQAVPVPQKTAPGTAGECMLYDTDPRTAAMIMAIVADELGVPLNELRFKSIREIKNPEEAET